jgi:hypothetical protein
MRMFAEIEIVDIKEMEGAKRRPRRRAGSREWKEMYTSCCCGGS